MKLELKMPKKVLVILIGDTNVRRIPSILKKNGVEEERDAIKFIALDTTAYIALRRVGINAYTLGEYLTGAQRNVVDSTALRIANNWYFKEIDKKEEYITYANYSLGDLVEYKVTLLFVEVLLLFEMVRCLVSCEKPDIILAEDENETFTKALYMISSAQNIKVMIFSPSASAKKKIIVQNILKNFKVIAKRLIGAIGDVYSKVVFRKSKSLAYIILVTDQRRLSSLLLKFKEKKYRIIFKDIKPYHNLKLVLRGIKSLPLNSLFSSTDKVAIRGKVKNFRKEAERIWGIISEDLNFQNLFQLNKISFWTLVKSTLRDIFLETFPSVVAEIERMQSLLKSNKIHGHIIMEDRSPFSKTAVLVCRYHGIPTLTIQNGATGPKGLPFSFVPVSADKIAVWGKITKKWLISLGVDEGKIVITGSHLLDKYSGINNSYSENYVLLTAQPYARRRCFASYDLTIKQMEDIYRAVFNAMEHFPDYHLVIRLHPNDKNPFLYKIVADEVGYNKIIMDKGDLVSIMSKCKILITPWSTTGFEAMFLGKPVITMNFQGVEDWVPFAKEGAAIGVCNEEELTQAVKSILETNDTNKQLRATQERFIDDYGYKNDGRSAERILSLVERMINSSNN